MNDFIAIEKDTIYNLIKNNFFSWQELQKEYDPIFVTQAHAFVTEKEVMSAMSYLEKKFFSKFEVSYETFMSDFLLPEIIIRFIEGLKNISRKDAISLLTNTKCDTPHSSDSFS